MRRWQQRIVARSVKQRSLFLIDSAEIHSFFFGEFTKNSQDRLVVPVLMKASNCYCFLVMKHVRKITTTFGWRTKIPTAASNFNTSNSWSIHLAPEESPTVVFIVVVAVVVGGGGGVWLLLLLLMMLLPRTYCWNCLIETDVIWIWLCELKHVCFTEFGAEKLQLNSYGIR